jgi:serine/threonine protein phosphatase PrpC
MSAEAHAPVAALACAVSVTPRPDPASNEDACAAVCLPGARLHGLVLADGLGSYARAGEAARRAVDGAAERLQCEAGDFGPGTLPRLFAQVHCGLRAHARAEAGGGEPPPQTFGTTLLVGVDTGAELVAGYAGNGAVWHLRGNLEARTPSDAPWNAVNLLNPHSLPVGGREVLYNLVDAAAPAPPVPAVVSVRKDPRFGDVLLVCTDGISSADQAIHGTDPAGSLWISAEPALLACFQALRDLFDAWDGTSELPLRDALHACLHDLRSRGMLEDDATVGVIVTADALRHQRRRRAAPPAAEPAPPEEEEEGCPASPASRA